MDDYRPGVRERLAEQGIELTPAQLVAERKKIYATICETLVMRGRPVPESYEAMIELLRESGYTFDEPGDPYGKGIHDLEQATHTGKRGHECPEWDGLYICEDCEEFQSCLCFPLKAE